MKSKMGAALILLGTFLLGGITGAVSFSLYKTHVQAASPGLSRRHPGPHDIAEELAKGLSLDAAQKEKLKVIISQSRERYRALSQQFRPQYEAIRGETRQEIRQILHEDQKTRFEEIIKEMDGRHRGQYPRPPK